jgi:hypothetical protein
MLLERTERTGRGLSFALVAVVLWITSCGSAPHPTISGTFTGTVAGRSAPAAVGVAGVNLSQSQVSAGNSPSMTVTLTAPAPQGGMAVQLTAAIFVPAGASSATAAVATSAVSSSTTVSVTAIYGQSIAASALHILPATIAPFSISLLPNTTTVADGQYGSVKLTTKIAAGFSHSLQLSASNVPSGVAVKFNPSLIYAPGAGTSKVSIAVSSPVAAGTYSIHLKAIDGTITATAALTLKIVVNPYAKFQGCWYQTGGHRYQGVLVSVENPGSYPLDSELYYGTACDPNTQADQIGFGTDVNFGGFDWIFYFDAFADQSNMSTRWHVGPDTSACFAYTSTTPACP